MAVSFPGLVPDSGHDGARLRPHWRNLSLLYGVPGLQKVRYIGFPVVLKALKEWLFVRCIPGGLPVGKEKFRNRLLLTSGCKGTSPRPWS